MVCARRLAVNGGHAAAEAPCCGGVRVWVSIEPASNGEDLKRDAERDSVVSGAPRVAASSYLNTAPLVWSFARGRRRGEVELVTDTAPARCADMLARGQVEAALVPVIEYQRLPETAVVPGVCVGARREVHSVVLVTRGKDLEEVGSVALSIESRTSAALVEVIFREFVGRVPKLEPFVPTLEEMLREHDAALVIGDPAMTFRREGLRVYDMAALWREFTGLGFVFAMWMVHESSAGRIGDIDF